MNKELIKNIILKFGGRRSMAQLLECSPSTIQTWFQRQSIPAKQQQRILSVALANNIKIKPAMFFELPVPDSKNPKSYP